MILPRIVFIGTTDFSVVALQTLYEAHYPIVAVVTTPDTLAGRGLHTHYSPVKIYCQENNIPFLQPVRLKDPSFIATLQSLKADLQVVVAFRMLPEVIWSIPPMGTINIHGSLLPKFRGAAPIQWAIIKGEVETGLTTFQLQQQIDTGHILLQQKVSILPTETFGELYEKLKKEIPAILLHTIEHIIKKDIQPIPQITIEDPHIAHAPKITADTCCINWNAPCSDIFNLIRGLFPSPTAFMMLSGKKCKIYKAEKEIAEHLYAMGEVITDHKSYFKVACLDGYMHILSLQLESKKRMDIKDFLRGYRG